MVTRPSGLGALGLLLALAGPDGQDVQRPLAFTRPTIVAAVVDGPQFFHQVIFEDETYRFLERHYGSGGKYTPGLFVHRKADGKWVQILELSTEHARLGRSPEDIALSVGWNYAYFVNQPFAPVPRMHGSFLAFPDRIVPTTVQQAYRLDFNSRLEREVSLTSFWVRQTDLDAAFEGKRARINDAPEAGHVRGAQVSRLVLAPTSVKGGEHVWWLVDTGAPVTIAAAHRSGLPAAGTVPVTLDISGRKLTDQLTLQLHPSRENQALGGILGAPLFQQFAVIIDYDRERLALVDAAGFQYRGPGAAISLDVSAKVPVVRVPISLRDGRQFDARLAVSTGTSQAVALFPAFADAQKVRRIPLGRSKAIRLGDVDLDDFPIAIAEGGRSPLTADACRCDGLIGNGLLRRFRVTFDYRRQRAYLEPGALRDVPYEYDLVGAKVVSNGKSFAIADVYSDTPAQKAGLDPGDVIEEIDGLRLDGRDLADVRRGSTPPGEHVLTIRRFEKVHRISIQTPTLPDLR